MPVSDHLLWSSEGVKVLARLEEMELPIYSFYQALCEAAIYLKIKGFLEFLRRLVTTTKEGYILTEESQKNLMASIVSRKSQFMCDAVFAFESYAPRLARTNRQWVMLSISLAV